MPDRLVAELLEFVGGEALVLRLDFLQAGDRWAGLLEPFEQARQTRLDAVDIERGDLSHGEKLDPQPQPAVA